METFVFVRYHGTAQPLVIALSSLDLEEDLGVPSIQVSLTT